MNGVIHIKDIRNIKELEFTIPSVGVHILTGENGIGKSTLLTCLDRIKNQRAYRTGFPASSNPNYDNYNGYIEYITDIATVKYSRRSNGEWRPNTRNVNILDIFPYPEVLYNKTNDKRLFVQTEEMRALNPLNAEQWLIYDMNMILGTTRFNSLKKMIVNSDLRGKSKRKPENRRYKIAFVMKAGTNDYFTEQNFSFGEIVLLNLLYDLHEIANGSLVLIDELELALHPSAQVRLIDMLRRLSVEKELTIIISTHSSSIIRSEKTVILLESQTDKVKIDYQCPPAKAIGAIGLRGDMTADIIVIVEDDMGKYLFDEMRKEYIIQNPQYSNLDIGIVFVGGFSNVISFYNISKNYIFYENIYLYACLDKDVKEDIIPYSQYSNTETIAIYNRHHEYIKFLPYTPEILLCEVLYNNRNELLQDIRTRYNKPSASYTIDMSFNFHEMLTEYELPFPQFNSQNEYNARIGKRGEFRNKCKTASLKMLEELRETLSLLYLDELYRLVFSFGVKQYVPRQEFCSLMALIMKRYSRR